MHQLHQIITTMPHKDADHPVVKRQKTAAPANASKSASDSSRIFAPFRVCPFFWLPIHHHLAMANCCAVDCRFSITYERPFHFDSSRQDYLSDFNLGWPLHPDLRSSSRAEPRLHHSTANPRRHHRDSRLEGKDFCSMGWIEEGRISGHLGLPERQEGR
jgi:hypothetical protein